MNQENEQRPYDKFLNDPPFTDRIVFRRDENGVVWTNVRHHLTWHSPDGFEFGYGGSGPSDFALNIVEQLLKEFNWNGPRTVVVHYQGEPQECFYTAQQTYQDFKWKFLVDVPRETGGEIPFTEAIQWLWDWIGKPEE